MRKTLIICDRCAGEEKGNPLHVIVEEMERENGLTCVGGWDRHVEICAACALALRAWMERPPQATDGEGPAPAAAHGPGEEKAPPVKSRKKIDTALVMEKRAQGMSFAQIAKETGFHENALRDATRRATKEMEDEGKIGALHAADEGKIGALHAAGWKVKDIAGDMGISVSAVKAAVAKMQ